MEVHKFSSRNIGGIVLIVAIVIIGLVVFPSSCTVVNPNERGVEVKLGQVQGDVIQPGLVWHGMFHSSQRSENSVLNQRHTKFLFHAEVTERSQRTCRL